MNIRQIQAGVIAPIALGLVVIVLLVCVISQYFMLSRYAADIAQQRKTLADLSRQAVENTKMSVDIQDMSAKLGGRYKEVSWDNQTPMIINQLVGIANARRLRIETLRPEPMSSSNGISRLPVRVTFKTSLGSLARTIDDIENTVPLLYIEQLGVRTSGDKSGLLEADLVVSLFAITDPGARQPSVLVPFLAKDNTKIIKAINTLNKAPEKKESVRVSVRVTR